MKLLLIATLTALCVGCSTTPPRNPTATTRVYETPAVTSADPARIQVIRDAGVTNFPSTVHVSLNGRRIASLNAGEAVEFAVDAGAHQLSAVPTEPFGVGQPKVIEATFIAGQRTIYRVGFEAVTASMSFYRDMTRY